MGMRLERTGVDTCNARKSACAREDQARAVLFVLAEVVRQNFTVAEERRERMTGAYLLLAGKPRANRRDLAVIDAELAK